MSTPTNDSTDDSAAAGSSPDAQDGDKKPRRAIPREFQTGVDDEPGPQKTPGDRRRVPPPPDPELFRVANTPRAISLVADSVITRPLAQLLSEALPDQKIGIVIEVRTDGDLTPDKAVAVLAEIVRTIDIDAPIITTRTFIGVALTATQVYALADGDARTASKLPGSTKSKGRTRQDQRSAPRSLIHRIWPNFEVRATIHRSTFTLKADAAQRTFQATGQGIVWAVLDSGVDASHAHFKKHKNLVLPKNLRPRNFVPGFTDDDALRDDAGHGTHVAGIIAGQQLPTTRKMITAATWYLSPDGGTGVEKVTLPGISGMAPQTKILPLKVLDENASGDWTSLIGALEYIEDLNLGGRELNVHGINLSLGYPFRADWFATGLTPLCRVVDRLVGSGVSVVVSAGNSGFGGALDAAGVQMDLPFGMTINDPGNAERAITVGSTSIKPHATGVSWFSSKGPTGDGRIKPDVVAPGERVVSAGAGRLLAEARKTVPDADYVESTGTSMSAPHVSGTIAGFLSVHREFIGRPDDVKRIIMDSATDLGRERVFQGAGLVDAMRAIQSV